MNYKQLLQANKYIEESYVLTTDDISVVQSFADRVCVYFNKGKRFCDLKCDSADIIFANDYSLNDCNDDMSTIRCYLQSIIDSPNYSSLISEIINFSDSISALNDQDYNKMLSIVREIYSAFQGKISFDDNIRKLCSFPGNGVQAKYYCALDISILNGMKTQLESYADELLMVDTSKKEEAPQVVINNNNNNSNVQRMDITFNLDVEINNAYKKIDEASLSPSEEESLKNIIAKLEELLRSEENKHKKWVKFKEIVKGIAEFSLKAAEIIAPLMIAAWPK